MMPKNSTKPYLVQSFPEEFAGRNPAKVALICEKKRLPYLEREEKTNQVARFLRQSGVQRQNRVAILLENSTEALSFALGDNSGVKNAHLFNYYRACQGE